MATETSKAQLDFTELLRQPSALLEFSDGQKYTKNAELNFTEILTKLTSLIKFGESDENIRLSILAEIKVSGSVTLKYTNPISKIFANVKLNITPKSKAKIVYDSAVIRPSVVEVVENIEHTKFLTSLKFSESDISQKLSNDSQLKFELSKFIGFNFGMFAEVTPQIRNENSLKAEFAKFVTNSGLVFYNLFMDQRLIAIDSKMELVKFIGVINNLLAESQINLRNSVTENLEQANFIGRPILGISNPFSNLGLNSFESRAEFAQFIYASRLVTRVGSPIIEPPPPPIEPPKPIEKFVSNALLNFQCLMGLPNALLNFGEACQYSSGTNANTSIGIIYVFNKVKFFRVSDGVEIKLESFNVGIDTDSFCWSFSGTVPPAEMQKVNVFDEELIEVELQINELLVFRFLLETFDDSKEFNNGSVSISGKSKSVLLSDPYSDTISHKFESQMTSRQIAQYELLRAGQENSFALDWQLISDNGWLIPANTFSYIDKTIINNLTTIADAGGGFVTSHPNLRQISILPKYDVAPWNWTKDLPKITLSDKDIYSRNIKRKTLPPYTGIYVSGEKVGVTDFIRRAATSGAYQAPMHISNLITEHSVGRAKGIEILSNTGKIANISITTPLIERIAAPKLRSLILVNDNPTEWIGMVTGYGISGRIGSREELNISQQLELERHYLKG